MKIKFKIEKVDPIPPKYITLAKDKYKAWCYAGLIEPVPECTIKFVNRDGHITASYVDKEGCQIAEKLIIRT